MGCAFQPVNDPEDERQNAGKDIGCARYGRIVELCEVVVDIVLRVYTFMAG